MKIVLQPNERREIPVSIKVPWDRYERIPVEISFVPIADNLQVSGFIVPWHGFGPTSSLIVPCYLSTSPKLWFSRKSG
jgi:hypothetical protein